MALLLGLVPDQPDDFCFAHVMPTLPVHRHPSSISHVPRRHGSIARPGEGMCAAMWLVYSPSPHSSSARCMDISPHEHAIIKGFSTRLTSRRCTRQEPPFVPPEALRDRWRGSGPGRIEATRPRVHRARRRPPHPLPISTWAPKIPRVYTLLRRDASPRSFVCFLHDLEGRSIVVWRGSPGRRGCRGGGGTQSI
jgi:hypothetical protein